MFIKHSLINHSKKGAKICLGVNISKVFHFYKCVQFSSNSPLPSLSTAQHIIFYHLIFFFY